jgi:hypothetical protein
MVNPNELDGNRVQKIQAIMNMYSQREKVGNIITEDGKWGPKTDGLWEVFLNHVFANHSTFSKMNLADTYKTGMHQWSEVSQGLSPTYAAYVNNTKGCLAFVTDGYNGNTDYGEGKKQISGGGGSGTPGTRRKRPSGGGRGQRASGGDQDMAISTGAGAATIGANLKPKVRVTLAGSGKNTLESIGFKSGTSSRLASTVATRVRGTITGGTVNLSVVTDKNGVVKSVRLAPGQRRNPVAKQFENLRNVVRRFLEKAGAADNNSIEPSRSRSNKLNPMRKSRKFELVLDFPAGDYN